MLDFDYSRRVMVESQLQRRGIVDERVLYAMGRVPRECFVPDDVKENAYDDGPLPIGQGQTISQPYIVARMIEAANIGARDRVLDVGGGSGYAAAVLSLLAAQVFTIERHAVLGDQLRDRLDSLGYHNVETRIGDGSRGWEEHAPFDAILVAATSDDIPQELRSQLRIGGRLIIPIDAGGQHHRLLRVTREGREEFKRQNLGDVLFVPLIKTPRSD